MYELNNDWLKTRTYYSFFSTNKQFYAQKVCYEKI